jgi:hypothetical protein
MIYLDGSFFPMTWDGFMRAVDRERCRTCLALASLVLLPDISEAQYFKPFHSSSRKFYAQLTAPAEGYSLAFDSARAAEGDSIFYHIGVFNDTSTLEVPPCMGWGNPYCYRADKPAWSGTLFRTNNAGDYWFGTDQGDSLTFRFAAPIGDTTVIFADATQRFSMVKTAKDTMTFLGYTDSVYTYIILHTDINGVPIISALDQQPIIVGKDLGLIRFFKVDHFPGQLVPLGLIGNKEPDVGLHQITSASLYDYQPGDVVQYRSYAGNTLPPGQPFHYYKNSILSRTDTPDSVRYEVAWESFTIGGTLGTGLGTLQYSKSEVLADLPFERFDGAVIQLSFTNSTSCPFNTWRLTRVEQTGLAPCGTAGCWIAADTQGPPPQSSSVLQLGVGQAHYFYQQGMFPGTNYFDISDIVYFMKDGITCGSEVHLGIGDGAQIPGITLFPNPASGSITIGSPKIFKTVQILDQAGRMLKIVDVGSQNTRLDIADLPAGMFQVLVKLQDGSIAHRSFVKVD